MLTCPIVVPPRASTTSHEASATVPPRSPDHDSQFFGRTPLTIEKLVARAALPPARVAPQPTRRRASRPPLAPPHSRGPPSTRACRRRGERKRTRPGRRRKRPSIRLASRSARSLRSRTRRARFRCRRLARESTFGRKRQSWRRDHNAAATARHPRKSAAASGASIHAHLTPVRDDQVILRGGESRHRR